jgi:hypothetical protein
MVPPAAAVAGSAIVWPFTRPAAAVDEAETEGLETEEAAAADAGTANSMAALNVMIPRTDSRFMFRPPLIYC